MTLYGVETFNNAGYLDTYRYDFSFPLKLTEDEKAAPFLKLCVSSCESIRGSLKKALKALKVFPDSFTESVVKGYLQKCEARFWRFVQQIADMNEASYKPAHVSFCKDIGDYARREFHEAIGTVSLRVRELVLAEEQEKILNTVIAKVQKGAAE